VVLSLLLYIIVIISNAAYSLELNLIWFDLIITDDHAINQNVGFAPSINSSLLEAARLAA